MSPRLALFFLFLFAPGLMPALAAPAYETFRPGNDELDKTVYSRLYDECADQTEGVTPKIVDCIDDEFDRVDEKLNANYRIALKRLQNNVARDALRLSQRESLKTRWEECDSSTDGDGGQAAMIDGRSCRLEEIARRALWLQRYGR